MLFCLLSTQPPIIQLQKGQSLQRVLRGDLCDVPVTHLLHKQNDLMLLMVLLPFHIKITKEQSRILPKYLFLRLRIKGGLLTASVLFMNDKMSRSV